MNGHAAVTTTGAAHAAVGEIQAQSVFVHGAGDLRLEPLTVPPPGPLEVRVSIKTTGLCGSDLHYYTHGGISDVKLQMPMVLGHESAGVVEAVGSGVSKLQVGDKVALEVGMACGDCAVCRAGRYNICRGMVFKSSARVLPHAHGTLRESITHPARLCYKLPDNVSLTAGALVEPLSVALQAASRSPLAPGASVLVLGAGAIGLLVSAVLRRTQGVAQIVIADIDETRLKYALSLGYATSSYLIPLAPRAAPKEGKSMSEADAVAYAKGKMAEGLKASAELASKIVESTPMPLSRLGFDAVYECTGVESCVQTGIYAAASGGKLIIVGMGNPMQTLPVGVAALREVDILGSFRYANKYPMAVDLLASGVLGDGIEKIATHKTALKDFQSAFDLARKGKAEDGGVVLKVIIES